MVAVMSLGFVSCSDDDPDGATIFPTDATDRDNLDQWLLTNYTYPYNVDFQYKWQKIESDMKYNLVPADSAKSAKLAIIVKYLWFDAYNGCRSGFHQDECTSCHHVDWFACL